eukprot:jgi/Botrbrau1/20615/Bobra.113_1s0041.1
MMTAMGLRINALSARQSTAAVQSRGFAGVRMPLSLPSSSARLHAHRRAVQPRAVQTDEKGTTPQFDTEELNAKAGEIIADIQKKWEGTEDKPAVIAITVVSFVVIWGLSGVLDAIDRLPLISNFLELVGLIVTAWFTYRYLIFGPDRQELRQNISEFYDKVTGKKSV